MTVLSAVWMTRRGSPTRVHVVDEALIQPWDMEEMLVTYCGRVVPGDALCEAKPWGIHSMDPISHVCLFCRRTRQFLEASKEMPLCFPEKEPMCALCLERVGLELAVSA